MRKKKFLALLFVLGLLLAAGGAYYALPRSGAQVLSLPERAEDIRAIAVRHNGDDPWHYEIREADEIARLFQELSALQLRRHVRSGLSFQGYPSSADSCFVTISYGDEPREISFFFSHWNADGQGGYIPSEGNFLGMDNRLFTVEDKGTISPSVSPE